MPVCAVHSEDYQFALGKAPVLRDGNDVALLANGVLVSRALEAADRLTRVGIRARVLNMSSIKPMDEEAVLHAARTTRGLVTAEEGLAAGGLGGAVAELLALHHPARVRMLGVPDVFAPTGSAEFLLEHFGLTADGIYDAALEIMAEEK